MDKKMELKRLLIYLAVTFGLTWAWFLGFIVNGFRWDLNDAKASFVGMGMLIPFLGNLITRWMTKEGFAMTGKDSLMLGISFKNRKWVFFLMALFLPWIYFELTQVIQLVVFPRTFDTEYYKQVGMDKCIALIFPLIAISQATILSFAALGEEGGWRGYMMPKLMKLVGYKKAVLVGGIIWGVWHAPLTCIGHNFGTEYPGFPYLGILIMCLLCTLMGIILTFITARTGSIWPAAIMHAVNNANPSILQFFVNEEKMKEVLPNQLIPWLFMMVPIGAIAGICFMRMSKIEKEAEKRQFCE